MTTKNSRADERAADAACVYSRDSLTRAQALLTALADIDETYTGDLDTVRNSDAPEVIKQEVINRLTQRYQECRARYMRELQALNRRRSGAM